MTAFTAANPGGVWQGNGINATTGAFNPSIAGAGIHEIIYTTPGSCGHADTIQVTVTAYDDPTILNTQNLFCVDHGDVPLQTVQGGGVWTLVSGNALGLDAAIPTFNTTQGGVGTHVLRYSFGGQCPTSSDYTITCLLYTSPSPRD